METSLGNWRHPGRPSNLLYLTVGTCTLCGFVADIIRVSVFAFVGLFCALRPAIVHGESDAALEAQRVENLTIQVDGRLDESAWATAPKAGDFKQYEPRAGLPLSENTEFSMLFDEHFLYLGVWCHDSDPTGIVARSMIRDGGLRDADYLYFMFDTFHDQRNGYVFSVNPTGARYDALVSNNVNRNSNWDGIWKAKTQIDASGWTCEIAIPFKTISFDPDGKVWGFNISRSIRRKSERGRWTSATPEVRTSMASKAGDILGLNGMKQGVGVAIAPYVIARHRDGFENGDGFDADFGADIRYRITPNLSATLSYNTDFAETEVDARIVNFTRFPLFFPEKRDFFLEDSGIYSFGGLSTSRRTPGLTSELVPYFTRRIGLSDEGEIVPLTLASKVAGRLGDYNIGFTHAFLDSQNDIGEKNVVATRLSRNILDQSTLGILATAGDPNSTGDNYVAGGDFQYRTTTFLEDKTLSAEFFALGNWAETQESGSISDYAYGASLSYPNDVLWASAKYLEIGDNFNPALGFVRRQGIRAFSTYASLKHRSEPGSWYRSVRTAYDAEVFFRLDGDLDSGEQSWTLFDIELNSADELGLRLENETDRPDEDFEIVDGVIIPAGDYEWNQARFEVDFSGKRPVWGDIGIRSGEFYDGWRTRLTADLQWNPTRHFGVGVDYSYNDVDLDHGDFEAHVAAVGMQWNFTPDLTWSHLAQYDSISETIGFNSRLRWEYRPGATTYLVLNQSYLNDDGSFRTETSDLTLKIGASIRF